jgi:type IV pilus assembly protein PilA
MLKNLRKRTTDQKGLTLIELLAVIVILGIIAAIAVPSIGGLINKTKNDAKVAEAVQIVNAAKLYITTNPSPKNLKHSDLDSYLEKVKDKDFIVIVSKDTSSGKFSYELQDHEGSQIVNKTDKVSERELLEFSGNDPEADSSDDDN